MTEQEAKALASELEGNKIYRVVGVTRSSFDEDDWIVLVMLRSVGGHPGICVYEYRSPEPRSINQRIPPAY